nr:tyrosine-type recombinase/integrase [Leisingera methylohalidivorans]
MESGSSICTRNQTMTGVKFLFRVTLRRHDLAAEVFSLKEPGKVPLVLSGTEVKPILLMAPSLKARVMLSLAYGCGLRAGEVVRLKVGGIDEDQKIIRIVQSKGPQGSQRDAARRHSGIIAGLVERASHWSGHRRGRA